MARTHQRGEARFQSDPPRRYRLEAVPGVSTWGAPCGCRRPSLGARTLRGQGQGAGRSETDAAQAPRGSDLHGHVGVFYIGLGEQFDGEKVEAYPPGSVIVLPGETWHFHWAKSANT